MPVPSTMRGRPRPSSLTIDRNKKRCGGSTQVTAAHASYRRSERIGETVIDVAERVVYAVIKQS